MKFPIGQAGRKDDRGQPPIGGVGAERLYIHCDHPARAACVEECDAHSDRLTDDHHAVESFDFVGDFILFHAAIIAELRRQCTQLTFAEAPATGEPRLRFHGGQFAFGPEQLKAAPKARRVAGGQRAAP